MGIFVQYVTQTVRPVIRLEARRLFSYSFGREMHPFQIWGCSDRCLNYSTFSAVCKANLWQLKRYCQRSGVVRLTGTTR